MIDIDRRRAVMSRSGRLGHCVCNTQNPCPCGTLLEHNVCICAGERLPVKAGRVALTQHVRKAGCASKIGQADLHRILKNLPPATDPRVLLGAAAGDDAGVFQLDDHLALVQTVDVFTPCVDDPWLFGQIAAANSLSDVYAMGAKPLTALSIVGFPIESLDGAIMEAMLQGGVAKLVEAGCSLIGGHSINDEEIKLGFAVTGVMDPRSTVARDRAEPGDLLVLTKPIGTGMVSFAAQLGLVADDCLQDVGRWMALLNKDAAELMVKYQAHAATDVTGFGLAGHLVSMVRGSGVNAEIDLAQVPIFGIVPDCVRRSVFGGAIDRNEADTMAWIRIADGVNTDGMPIVFDPQTSGGMLVALPEAACRDFRAEMEARGHTAVSVIGRIVAKDTDQPEGRVIVTNGALGRVVGPQYALQQASGKPAPPSARIETEEDSDEVVELTCCDAPLAAAKTETAPTKARSKDSSDMGTLPIFQEFLKEANKPGLIDGRGKKLITIALSIVQHCHPCLKIHLKGAMEMGLSREEIDEAANLAIAFGGCPSLMFYREVCQELGL